MINKEVKEQIETQIENAFTERVDLAIGVWEKTIKGENKSELRYKAAKDLIERLVGKPPQVQKISGVDTEEVLIKIKTDEGGGNKTEQIPVKNIQE